MEPLREFAADVWIADGPIVRAVGFPFPTRMIVVKLGDGSLWINSPVIASPSEMEGLSTIGTVKYLVAPTPLHVWRLQRWAEAFPEAQVWLPPQRRPRPSSPGHVLGDLPPRAWSAEIDQLVFRGSMVLDEVHFLHRKTRTLIIADFIQNYRVVKGRRLFNAFLRCGGVLDGGVPVDIRLSFNKRIGRESLVRLLSWDFDNLIVAHGECVRNRATAFVERAFGWLGLRES